MDNTVWYTNLMVRDYSRQGVEKLDVQPKCIAVSRREYMVTVYIQQIGVLKGQKKGCSLDDPDYSPKW